MSLEMENQISNVGEKLYSLRKHLLLSRKEFCLKHNIPDRVLRALELSMISINLKLIEAFNAENIFCSKEWLLAGEGPSPILPQA
jgi:hypothetical protein